MPTTRARAEAFLDELATITYELRTKHGIPQEDLLLSPTVRIDDFVERPDAFKNVAKV